MIRRLWLYDTFEGMPEPGERDVGPDGRNRTREWQRNRQEEINEWCYHRSRSPREHLAAGIRPDAFELVQGRVERHPRSRS